MFGSYLATLPSCILLYRMSPLHQAVTSSLAQLHENPALAERMARMMCLLRPDELEVRVRRKCCSPCAVPRAFALLGLRVRALSVQSILFDERTAWLR